MDITQAIRMLFGVIRPLRENKYHKQQDFAYTARINCKHYSKLEVRADEIKFSTLLRICIYLNIKPWVLLEQALKDNWGKLCEDVRKADEQRR